MHTENFSDRRRRRHARKHRKFRWRAVFCALVISLVAIMASLPIVTRYWGLPQLKERLKAELQERGIVVSIGRLYLDPLLRVVAKDVKIFQTSGDKIARIHVARMRFAFNWISWWRGRPFLSGAIARNADMSFPITEETAVALEAVNMDVELRAGKLVVREAEGKIGNLLLQLRGTIILEEGAPPPPRPSSLKEVEARAKAWRQIRQELDALSSPLHASLEFDTPFKDPLQGIAKLSVTGKNVRWRGVLLHRIDAQASCNDHVAQLDRFQVDLARGGFNARGIVRFEEKNASLEYRSDADLTLLRAALPRAARERMDGIFFPTLPLHTGLLEFKWDQGFFFFGKAKEEWKNFIINNTTFDHLRSTVAFDGKQWFVSELSIQNKTGEFSLECLYDENKNLKGNLKSSIDPTTLRPLFGAAAQPLLRNIAFLKDETNPAGAPTGPRLECRIAGVFPNVKLEGKAEVKNFIYVNGRGTRAQLASVQTSLVFENSVLHLPDLKVVRVAGEEGGADVDYDFKNRLVSIRKGKCHFHVQKFTPLFGGKLEIYTQPYRFIEPPVVTMEGVVDLKEEEKTNFKLQFQAAKGLKFDFLGKTLTFGKTEGSLSVVNKQLTVELQPSTELFAGKIKGEIKLDLSQDGPPYQARCNFTDVSFEQVLKTYFNKEN
ncbi:MAG: hypothetical protein V1746_04925, partial [bacterium]